MQAKDLIFTTPNKQLTAINPKNQEWLAGASAGPHFDQSSSLAGKIVTAAGAAALLWGVVWYLIPWILDDSPPTVQADIRPYQGFALVGVAAFLLFFGIWQIRFSRDNTDLGSSATHIIGGLVGPASKGGPKGAVTMFGWTAQSPATGQEIGGMLQFGRGNSRHGRIAQGMTIPVLWKSDREARPL